MIKKIWHGIVIAFGIIIIFLLLLDIFETKEISQKIIYIALTILIGVGLYKFIKSKKQNNCKK